MRKVFNSRVKAMYKKTHVPQCKRCCFFAPWNSGKGMSIHHITPLQDGGDNSESNLVTVCSFCHYEWHSYWEGKTDFQEFCNQVPLHVIGAVMNAHDGFGNLDCTVEDIKAGWVYAKEQIMVTQPYKDDQCTEYTEKHWMNWVDW